MSDVPCGTWEDYTICKQAGTVAEVTTWDDKAEFKDMHPALCLLGYSEAERNELYTMLCISLWLGNLKFKEDGQGSKVTNADVLKKSAELLQVPPDRLENAMVQRTMGGGVVEARSAARLPDMWHCASTQSPPGCSTGVLEASRAEAGDCGMQLARHAHLSDGLRLGGRCDQRLHRLQRLLRVHWHP